MVRFFRHFGKVNHSRRVRQCDGLSVLYHGPRNNPSSSHNGYPIRLIIQVHPIFFRPTIGKMGWLIIGEPRIKSSTTLYVSGYVMDRIVYKNSLRRKKDIYEIVISTVQVFAALGRGIFGVYLNTMNAPNETLNLDALWRALTWTPIIDSEGGSAAIQAVSFLAWESSADDTSHGLYKTPPKNLKRQVQGWERERASREREGFALDILEKMERDITYRIDLFYTEKGYFGATHLGDAEAFVNYMKGPLRAWKT